MSEDTLIKQTPVSPEPPDDDLWLNEPIMAVRRNAWRHGWAEGYRTALRQGSETWQAIETAPKDGTEVLAVSAFGYAHSLYLVTSWEDGAWDMPDHWKMQPTHWMPLPPPPLEGSR